MRKVLSFVLVLSLVLGSFSMAFAANEAQASLSDIAGHANEEAITVNFNLKIIDGMGDGTFAPDQQVTRAQFAAMITRALAIPESALAGYKTSTFKDTAGYGWAVPYLAFCQSKGILVGDGAGNVMPGRTVSVNEAVTMVMRAVGYTNNSAALVGVWPANYVSLAQNSKLYKNVATAVGVTRANAAQIIYNALTVDKVEVSADGTTKVLSDRTVVPQKIVNMLTTGLNATSKVDIIDGSEDTLINLTPYVGKMVTIYQEAEKPFRILAIASEESTAIAGEFSDNVTISAGAVDTNGVNVKFEGDDDVDYTLSIKNDGDHDVQQVMLNGENKGVVNYPISSDTSVTLNADVSGKTIKNIYTVTIWDADGTKKVSKSDLNQISEERLLGYDFATLKDGSVDKTSFQLVGVSSLDKIAENNVVYVYTKGKDGKEINKVEVGTTVVTGEVTKIKGKNYTVDGKEYKFADRSTADKPDVGDDVVLYLDAAGKIFALDNKTGSNDKYAVLINDTPVKDEYQFYTANDEKEWINVKSDAKPAVTGATTFSSIIGYTLNKDGAMSSATNGGVTTLTAGQHATLEAITLLNINGTKRSVKSDAVVFGITGSGATAEITVATGIGNVDTGKDLGLVSVKLNSKNEVVAMIVNEKWTSKTDDDVYAVIDGIAKVPNADKDKVLQLTGYANGAKLDKLTDDDYSKAWGSSAPSLPELWKIDVKADGTIKGRTVLSADAGTVTSGVNVTVTAIKNDGSTLFLSDSDTVALAKNVIVYRAIIADKEVDSYALSDKESINEGNTVYLFDTDTDDDAPGYEVVIYVTKW